MAGHNNEERREVAERLRDYENMRDLYSEFSESTICAFLDMLNVDGYLDWRGICNRLADLIDSEPERIIRCRDCKHYNPERGECAERWHETYDGYFFFEYVEQDDFCAWGEPREGE